MKRCKLTFIKNLTVLSGMFCCSCVQDVYPACGEVIGEVIVPDPVATPDERYWTTHSITDYEPGFGYHTVTLETGAKIKFTSPGYVILYQTDALSDVNADDNQL